MEANKPAKLRIFIDADVLFAGAASPNEHSVRQQGLARKLILRMVN